MLGVEVAQLGAGRIFGELALQTNVARGRVSRCCRTPPSFGSLTRPTRHGAKTRGPIYDNESI